MTSAPGGKRESGSQSLSTPVTMRSLRRCGRRRPRLPRVLKRQLALQQQNGLCRLARSQAGRAAYCTSFSSPAAVKTYSK